VKNVLIVAAFALITVWALGAFYLPADMPEQPVAQNVPAVEQAEQGSPGANANREELAVATFAGGCFWCVEAAFEKVPGVVSVVSGYTGGQEQAPTYQAVASGATGHTEAVQVHYDDSVISYEGLLQTLWRG